MDKLKSQCRKLSYIILGILTLFSVSLIFNNNLWFDEAYTLSLIQHNYSEIIEILESDMHPPLYFTPWVLPLFISNQSVFRHLLANWCRTVIGYCIYIGNYYFCADTFKKKKTAECLCPNLKNNVIKSFSVGTSTALLKPKNLQFFDTDYEVIIEADNKDIVKPGLFAADGKMIYK